MDSTALEDLGPLVDNPLLKNILNGLYLDGNFNISPIFWGLIEAIKSCFPVIFCSYVLLFTALPKLIGHESSNFGSRTMVAQEGFGIKFMDAHKGIYSSFIDDSRATSNLNDVEKIRFRGYNKYRYVSSRFLKEHGTNMKK